MSLVCRVCGTHSEVPIFSGLLLGQQVDYFDCVNCGYIQTQEPTWLEQAYKSAINNCDTGIMVRNQTNVGIVLATLATLGNRFGHVVDCAGGYGILVRMLRDLGIEALWADPYCENLLAMGFEHKSEKAALVTAFEAFEHFVNPKEELERIFTIAPNVLFSTEIIPTPVPKQDDWWYYGPNHGQHIGFFRAKTLSYLAHYFGKHFVTDGRAYHLMTEKPASVLRWCLYRRLAKYCPCFFTRGMASKTWSDFEKMSKVK